jgi:hypothetical protein
MKANELRIGNWVSTIYGMEFQVYPMAFKQMPTDEKHNLILNTWKPIPLTEKWLFKFGFIKSSDNNYYKGDKFTIYNRFENFGLIGGLLSWKEFKYVHQLQNLYFALTGEELINGGKK